MVPGVPVKMKVQGELRSTEKSGSTRNGKADILCLQETKLEGDKEIVLWELGGGRLTHGVSSPAVGRARGIMILWNPIEVEEVVADKLIGRESVSISLGDEQRCSFWTDRWCGNLTLDHLFPDLFANTSALMATIADIFKVSHAGGTWVPTFRRNISVERATQLLQMFAILAPFRLTGNREDQWSWRWEKSGHFLVKSAYLMLVDGGLRHEAKAQIWDTRSPLKIKIFIWMVSHGRFPTCDKISRFLLNIPSSCCLCGVEEENLDHLLTVCSFSKVIWDEIGKCTQINIPFTGAKELLLGWSRKFPSKVDRVVWWIILHATIWAIWIERNNRIFRRESEPEEAVIQGIKSNVL
ncbi:hypothetical protein Taro_037517, partial [Colocasia esculenta]|nr:hypothetical protein [Colocasia esculenta]